MSGAKQGVVEGGKLAFMMSSGLRVPIPVIPIPAFAVPYAAPIAVVGSASVSYRRVEPRLDSRGTRVLTREDHLGSIARERERESRVISGVVVDGMDDDDEWRGGQGERDSRQLRLLRSQRKVRTLDTGLSTWLRTLAQGDEWSIVDETATEFPRRSLVLSTRSIPFTADVQLPDPS